MNAPTKITYSEADAQAQLPALIERVIAGDTVLIARDGQPVAEIHGVGAPAAPKPITEESLRWLEERRAKRRTGVNAADFVRQLRDED